MAKIFKGDVNFGFVINQTGAQPLDSRSVVQNYEELLKSETFGSAIYNGMTVATVDEQKVYMLIDKTKATVADGWKEVGAGGAVAVDTYAEAVVLATSDNIGQVIFVKNSDETYERAPYIVTGEGSLQKLAASNSDGTGLDADVAKLKETVGDADGGLVKTVAELNDNKVDKVAGSRLMTEDEGNKLATIANGAEVNFIKKLSNLETTTKYINVDSDGMLSLDLSTKVDKGDYQQAISDINSSLSNKADAETLSNYISSNNNNVTSLTERIGEGFTKESSVAVQLESVRQTANAAATQSALNALEEIVGKSTSNEGSGTGLTKRIEDLESLDIVDDVHYNKNDKKVYLVAGEKQIGEGFSVTDFIKDGMINTVTYNKDNQTITISFNTDAGKDDITITLTDLVNIYEAGNGLTLSEDGKTFAVDFTKVEAYGEAAKVQENLNALSAIIGEGKEGEINTVMAKLAALASKDTEHDNAIAALQALKVNNKAFEDGAVVLDAGDIALETAITSDNGEGNKVEQYPVSSSIQSVLQSLNNRITAAVSGGLTSIAAGDGIAVTDVIGNSQTVSIKVSSAANNAVTLNTDGIYVERLMVDGNDVE